MARTRRCDIIDENQVGTYHCINRCVRRAYLCGRDAITNRSFDHRKQWLQDRLQELAGLFAVDIMAFAVMCNHFHLVVRNRPDVASEWTDEEVAQRWARVYPSRTLDTAVPDQLATAQVAMLVNQPNRIAELRRRLSSISWFMKCLAEPLARWANAEDKCTGRFWQGRFRCQALLDEGAVAACMTYVDLNPVRAGLAATPGKSRFTSAALRRQALEHAGECDSNQRQVVSAGSRTSTDRHVAEPRGTHAGIAKSCVADGWLSPIPLNTEGVLPSRGSQTSVRASNRGCLDMRLTEYLQLLDWAASISRSSPSQGTSSSAPPVLHRLGLEDEQWRQLIRHFSRIFRLAAGNPASLAKEANRRGCQWIQGLGASRRIFGQSSA